MEQDVIKCNKTDAASLPDIVKNNEKTPVYRRLESMIAILDYDCNDSFGIQ